MLQTLSANVFVRMLQAHQVTELSLMNDACSDIDIDFPDGNSFLVL